MERDEEECSNTRCELYINNSLYIKTSSRDNLNLNCIPSIYHTPNPDHFVIRD